MLPESNALQELMTLLKCHSVCDTTILLMKGITSILCMGSKQWVNNGTTNFQQRKMFIQIIHTISLISMRMFHLRILKLNHYRNPDEMITSYDYRSCYENDLVSLVGGGQGGMENYLTLTWSKHSICGTKYYG